MASVLCLLLLPLLAAAEPAAAAVRWRDIDRQPVDWYGGDGAAPFGIEISH